MAAGRFDFPTPASSGDPDHTRCPVCGWSPCTSTCSLGLHPEDLLRWSLAFEADEFARGLDMPRADQPKPGESD